MEVRAIYPENGNEKNMEPYLKHGNRLLQLHSSLTIGKKSINCIY